MIKRILKNDNDIINYIGNDYGKCLYLYLDYKKYGLKNKNIKVWKQYNENDEIISLILMYYSGMHIYSKDNNLVINEIIDLINKEKPSVICSCKKTIKKLDILDNYESEYGWVRSLSNIDEKYNNKDVITNISLDDIKEITELILSDEIGNSYTYDDLFNQIKERNKEKYGRNYILKKDGNIVSHSGTGAENDEVAIVNYVITNKKYRGKGYAFQTVSKMCYDLINEGKKVYLINYSDESTKLYNKIGFKISDEIGKLNRI